MIGRIPARREHGNQQVPIRATPRFRVSPYTLGSSAERSASYRRVEMNASAREANGSRIETSGVIGEAAIA
jgi:hypothetical protein